MSLFLPSGLWIMAAKSELEDMNSSESARHLFLRALRFHPEDKKVFQEVHRNSLGVIYNLTTDIVWWQSSTVNNMIEINVCV